MESSEVKKASHLDSSFISSNWSELLKCPVCFNYFTDPVNLFCGHTFCKRCLMKMAINTKIQKPDIPFSRLRMWCPTCRHGIPVRLYVGPNTNVCYVLRDLVQSWQRLFRNARVCCRSVSTQTVGPQLLNTNIVLRDCQNMERNSEICAEERFVHVTPDCVVPFIMAGCGNEYTNTNENRRDLAPDFSESEVYDSDDGSTDEGDEVHFTENVVHEVDVINRYDITPRRMWMLVFWVVYTGIMAVISHGFLPYIIVYSLVLLLIIYVDGMQHQAIHHTNE